jgi:hypothetical protein
VDGNLPGTTTGAVPKVPKLLSQLFFLPCLLLQASLQRALGVDGVTTTMMMTGKVGEALDTTTRRRG